MANAPGTFESLKSEALALLTGRPNTNGKPTAFVLSAVLQAAIRLVNAESSGGSSPSDVVNTARVGCSGTALDPARILTVLQHDRGNHCYSLMPRDQFEQGKFKNEKNGNIYKLTTQLGDHTPLERPTDYSVCHGVLTIQKYLRAHHQIDVNIDRAVLFDKCKDLIATHASKFAKHHVKYGSIDGLASDSDSDDGFDADYPSGDRLRNALVKADITGPLPAIHAYKIIDGFQLGDDKATIYCLMGCATTLVDGIRRCVNSSCPAQIQRDRVPSASTTPSQESASADGVGSDSKCNGCGSLMVPVNGRLVCDDSDCGHPCEEQKKRDAASRTRKAPGNAASRSGSSAPKGKKGEKASSSARSPSRSSLKTADSRSSSLKSVKFSADATSFVPAAPAAAKAEPDLAASNPLNKLSTGDRKKIAAGVTALSEARPISKLSGKAVQAIKATYSAYIASNRPSGSLGIGPSAFSPGGKASASVASPSTVHAAPSHSASMGKPDAAVGSPSRVSSRSSSKGAPTKAIASASIVAQEMKASVPSAPASRKQSRSPGKVAEEKRAKRQAKQEVLAQQQAAAAVFKSERPQRAASAKAKAPIQA
jgi:hypothetical protein